MKQVSLPRTQGINYIGSKLKILPYVIDIINTIKPKVILDGFAGTTRVSQALSYLGYTIYCNDFAIWSKIFGTCYLLNNRSIKEYQEIVDHLNSLLPHDGWFTEHYGGLPNKGFSSQCDGLKKPFQIHNTRKLDAIRDEIDRLKLNEIDKSVMLTSLLLALNEVDNTLGHYVSYLKEWSKRSYKDMELKVPQIIRHSNKHCVYQKDIFDLLSETEVDLAYFDPPYGSNNEKMPASRVRYNAYYHLLKTIILNDKPSLFGKAQRRTDTRDKISASIFEDFRKDSEGRFIVINAIERLLKETQAKWILLSYSSGGRATEEQLLDLINTNATLSESFSINYKKNVMSKMSWTNKWSADPDNANYEYLYLIRKE